MTDPTFDRTFTAWLDERAQPHAPTGLAADIVERTARSRPRPAWRIPERWFSMPTTMRLALLPRGLMLLMALWLILALTVAGAAIGGRLTFTRAVLPAPVTGPAANGLIAFERGGNGDIYVMEPDGSNERVLIGGPAFEWGPVWSRDGTRIAYRSQVTERGTESGYAFEAPTDIIVADADGTDAVTVATMTGLYRFGDLDWSPDGTAVVFNTFDPTHETSCRQVPYEFCGSRAFTAATDGSTGAIAIGDPELDVRGPVWSPDGRTIAFGGGTSTIRLYVMAADGSDVRPVSTSSGRGGDWTWVDDPTWSFLDQAWSPDGTHIVTQVERPDGSGHDIVLVPADGSGETIVTDTGIDVAEPTFAVDGSIGWEARNDRGGSARIEVLGADGVRTALPGKGGLSFSPDGQYVLTNASDVDLGPDTLYVLERDGTIVATIPDATRYDGGVASWQRLAP